MISLYWPDVGAPGSRLAMDGDPLRHARARRVRGGELARVLDGEGRIAFGRVAAVERDALMIDVERLVEVPKPVPLEVVVPVADRERMLLAAEKCVELQVTSWQPVFYERSRSVSPRGEGEAFRRKLVARMRSALEQSGGGWLPSIGPEMSALEAFNRPETDAKLLLEQDGSPFMAQVPSGPSSIAVGPEGGFERVERETALQAGWTPVSLTLTTLRFETALISGVALIRAAQLTRGGP